MDSKDPRDAVLVKRLREKTFGPLKKEGPPGNTDIGQGPTQTDVSNVSTSVNFEDGSAQFNAVARDAVVDMATRAKDQRFVVEVRGHISPSERMRSGGDRGYRLAFDRAQAVANLLATNGVKWENIRLVACADNERAVPRAYTDAEQRKNQRVEVVITKQLVAPDPFSRETRPGGEVDLAPGER
jgi:outer membrane protein OmpA-like peptidoglycan-associated protein